MSHLLTLFWSFLQVGAFSVGGGYAAMPLIENQVCHLHTWLSAEEFAHLVTIAEMTPGPIAINSATFVGIQIAGLPGAIVATVGCVFPSCMIVMTLAYVYYRFRGLNMVQGILAGLRPAVVAMIASAGISLLILALYGERNLPSDFTHPDWISAAIFALAFIVLRVLKIKPLWVMAGSGVMGVILYAIF